MLDNYDSFPTEQLNPNTMNIDRMSTSEIVRIINNEDKTVPFAVEKELDAVAQAIDLVSERIKKGGRLFYVGAGTSGRLGIVDAAECPPTYGVSQDVVQGIIAGGREAMYRSIENAEDDSQASIADLKEVGFTPKDVCLGISASGSAMYVMGALTYAATLGASTIALCCNKNTPYSEIVDILISPDVGPEAINGSTRMKAGTAQKLILNMISTGVMIKLGRVRGNLLIHMHPTNKKLIRRAVRIIMLETGVSDAEARRVLEKSGYDINYAIMSAYKENKEESP